MMNRKSLEPSDYPVLKPVFEKQSYNLSIYSLLSLIVWNTGPIRSYYTFDGDRLIISSESSMYPEDRYLIMPISGRGLIIPEELHDLAVDHGYRHYRFVPGDYLAIMERKKAEQWFQINEQTGFEDYVYRTEDLIQLKGNRYARKRNLIHQFMREYNDQGRVSVDDLRPTDTDVCLTFLDHWCEQRQCDQDESLACEKRALIHALTHMEILESAGIVVRIDGGVSAIAIMSVLNEKTGVLHFEKAFSNIRGLYQFLDNECAKKLFSQYEFINKESDLNIAELAQSKKSYHPVKRIKSYCLTVR
ncbi:MAG: phosphatidylglycerol lysyltransferase domain-containing protein [Pseudomonadota bacterium]